MKSYLIDFIEQYMTLTEDEKVAIVDLNIIRSLEKGSDAEMRTWRSNSSTSKSQ